LPPALAGGEKEDTQYSGFSQNSLEMQNINSQYIWAKAHGLR